jgi:hypothetical protein
MAIERHPELPNVATVFDLVTSDETRQVLHMLYAPWSYGQPIAAPPGVPQDRVQILRDAFKSTMEDPSLISEAKRIRMEVNWMPGAEINEVMESIYKSSDDVIAQARDIYGIQLK